MDTLPDEIIIHIAKMDNIIISLSCCCRKYYELLKPLIWKEIIVDNVNDLVTYKPCPSAIKNLKNFTCRLTLNNNILIRPVTYVHGLYLSQFLYSLNPNILTALITDFPGPEIRFFLNLFPNLKELCLRELPDPCALLKLKHLKALCVESSNWKFLKEVLVNHDFDSLNIGYGNLGHCDSLIELVSRQTNLKTLRYTYCSIHTTNVAPFQTLVNLRWLEFNNMDIADKSFNLLWKHLTLLKRLDLGQCRFSSEGIRDIDRLVNLECLVLIEDNNCLLSLDLMQYFSLLPRLAFVNIPDHLFATYTGNNKLTRIYGEIASYDKMYYEKGTLWYI